jgi:hypothetical protein
MNYHTDNPFWLTELPCFDDLELQAAPSSWSWKKPENRAPVDVFQALKELPCKRDLRLESLRPPGPGEESEDRCYLKPRDAVALRNGSFEPNKLVAEDGDLSESTRVRRALGLMIRV